MRHISQLLVIAGLSCLPSFCSAQPGDEQAGGIVTRLLALDKNNDGQVTKDEVTFGIGPACTNLNEK